MKASISWVMAGMSLLSVGCKPAASLSMKVHETSASGHQLKEVMISTRADGLFKIHIQPEKKYQTITGFGGSFTEASTYLLNQLSAANRSRILEAYFGDDGARYSLTRTHMNSCDFSLKNYAYAMVPGDTALTHFSIEEDRQDIIPAIKDAKDISSEGFKIIASPWTAPPWMKDNSDWRGGKLLPAYRATWARYFSKYIEAYTSEGIDIWGITVENEPLGNDSNWESMHFTPEEMTAFVTEYLGPQLDRDGHDVVLLGYDQNRGDELRHWVDAQYATEAGRRYFDGTAVHWYESTFDYCPDMLDYAHGAAPDKHLIQTEACVDAEVPAWKDDAWYWSKEATDWGWDWAPADKKHLHPKYVPVYRYARDIIGCLNHHVDGWIDWNMVLDRQGGPNWAKNWCVAPVIVDPDADEVYFTPLYYTMVHFSRYIRPGAQRIGWEMTGAPDDIMTTAVQNPDGSFAVIVFNPTEEQQHFELVLGDMAQAVLISPRALQTIIINAEQDE